MDVLEVFEAAGKLVEAAREGGALPCWSLRPGDFEHTSRESRPAYRSPAEEAAWLEKDPLTIALRELGDRRLLSAERAREIEQDVDAELAKAVEFARTSPLPRPEDALADVFA